MSSSVPAVRTAARWITAGQRPNPALTLELHPTGRVAGNVTLDVLDGRIQTIRNLVNPEELGHLGPLADPWTVAREVKQARRSGEGVAQRPHPPLR